MSKFTNNRVLESNIIYRHFIGTQINPSESNCNWSSLNTVLSCEFKFELIWFFFYQQRNLTLPLWVLKCQASTIKRPLHCGAIYLKVVYSVGRRDWIINIKYSLYLQKRQDLLYICIQECLYIDNLNIYIWYKSYI